MKDFAKNGVRYFYSDWQPGRSAEEVKQQALEFHRANQRILEHVTLIPFRFPTSVAKEQELKNLIDAQSSDYSQELVRLRNMVQMKVTVEGSSHTSTAAANGTEYLKQRLLANAPMNSAVEEIKHAAAHWSREAKQSRRGNGITLYFLVAREKATEFRSALERLSRLAAKVTFSGPWPPSEFVNCYPEVSPVKHV